jgi:hypothetical protein
MNMIKTIKDNFVWIKDLAIICFMAGILYLNSHYVTIEQFRASEAANISAHEAIHSTLISVDKTLALMARNQVILTEHEIVLKSHDKSINSLDSRIQLIEKTDTSSQVKLNTFNIFELNSRVKSLESSK